MKINHVADIRGIWVGTIDKFLIFVYPVAALMMINTTNYNKYYDKLNIMTNIKKMLFVLFFFINQSKRRSEFNDTPDRYEIFYRKV